jgi:DNA-damage-inducible protein J
MTNTVVRARIDEHVKEEAAAVLATIGSPCRTHFDS